MLDFDEQETVAVSRNHEVGNWFASLKIEATYVTEWQLRVARLIGKRLDGEPSRDSVLEIDATLSRHPSRVLPVSLVAHRGGKAFRIRGDDGKKQL
jgi:hypothetical protein